MRRSALSTSCWWTWAATMWARCEPVGLLVDIYLPMGVTPEKGCAEHAMVVALRLMQANPLTCMPLPPYPLCQVSQAGTVRVEKLMEIERYSHVMHISSTGGCLHTSGAAFGERSPSKHIFLKNATSGTPPSDVWGPAWRMAPSMPYPGRKATPFRHLRVHSLKLTRPPPCVPPCSQSRGSSSRASHRGMRCGRRCRRAQSAARPRYASECTWLAGWPKPLSLPGPGADGIHALRHEGGRPPSCLLPCIAA